MNEVLARMVPGAFHVTTLECAVNVLATGIMPGSEMSHKRGRMDIHFSIFSPLDPRLPDEAPILRRISEVGRDGAAVAVVSVQTDEVWA